MFEAFLRQFTTADWAEARDAALPHAHEVDRDATRIWWYFFPLALADVCASVDEARDVDRRLRIEGNPRLAADQVDTSHWFLHGHRYWPEVKAAIITRADSGIAPASLDLTSIVREIADAAAAAARVEASLLIGISLVGLMTLRQVGLRAFQASTSARSTPSGGGQSPEAVLAQRARDDAQGAFGFLRSAKRFSIVFDERRGDGRFPILDGQDLTKAAADDTRDYRHGSRPFHEGPIPSQCRSANCGTCWVGVLGGREKLNEIEPHETQKLREFGYIDVRDSRPIIRLACQARASGNVTIVTPPWNGLIGSLYAAGAGPVVPE